MCSKRPDHLGSAKLITFLCILFLQRSEIKGKLGIKPLLQQKCWEIFVYFSSFFLFLFFFFFFCYLWLLLRYYTQHSRSLVWTVAAPLDFQSSPSRSAGRTRDCGRPPRRVARNRVSWPGSWWETEKKKKKKRTIDDSTSLRRRTEWRSSVGLLPLCKSPWPPSTSSLDSWRYARWWRRTAPLRPHRRTAADRPTFRTTARRMPTNRPTCRTAGTV